MHASPHAHTGLSCTSTPWATATTPPRWPSCWTRSARSTTAAASPRYVWAGTWRGALSGARVGGGVRPATPGTRPHTPLLPPPSPCSPSPLLPPAPPAAAPPGCCCCCPSRQGDSTQRGVKDLDVVLGRERGTLVLDDTEGVWPRHRDNLVLIERYFYFPADAARFGFGCAPVQGWAGWAAAVGGRGSVVLVVRRDEKVVGVGAYVIEILSMPSHLPLRAASLPRPPVCTGASRCWSWGGTRTGPAGRWPPACGSCRRCSSNSSSQVGGTRGREGGLGGGEGLKLVWQRGAH